MTKMIFPISAILSFFFFFFKILADALASPPQNLDFCYNGFPTAAITLKGSARIISGGLLRLTDATKEANSYAMFPRPIPLVDPSSRAPSSFSTSFAAAFVSPYSDLTGPGIAFFVSNPGYAFPRTSAPAYMGLLNPSIAANHSSNHSGFVAVEFDTVLDPELRDIDDNHIGIDNNSLISSSSAHAAYFSEAANGFKNLSIRNGDPFRAWVDYSGHEKRINVSLSPIGVASQPRVPLLSVKIDLLSALGEEAYLGFSSSTGALAIPHYVLGWSFRLNGRAQELDTARLPKPPPAVASNKNSEFLKIGMPIAAALFLLLAVSAAVYAAARRKNKYKEMVEDWEREYRPHRISYKDLFMATKGFREEELLGTGGFGMVYKGVLPSSGVEVAVKRVCHKSNQGMKEFVAEIVSLGRLRHRNLVQLLGYCRRKDELFLVYDFMPNGSLDRFLFGRSERTLSWSQRLKIIRGVASGLLYLHEEWEQVVLHRDVKASNILLDGELCARLGDFGLARLYDHGANPQTTRIVGTLGYIAPELTRTGKATTMTDVFAFGAFVLEVACGKRPLTFQASADGTKLVNFVAQCWRKGEILAAADDRLGKEYAAEEMELVLKLGLLCSHPVAEMRPSMRQVVQFLEQSGPSIPEISAGQWPECDEKKMASSSSMKGFAGSATGRSFFDTSSTVIAESLLSGGR